MMKAALLLLLLALLAAPGPAQAHEFSLDKLQIIHPAIPATSVNATSAPIYMVLSNDGTEPERLLAIETDFGTVTFQRPAATQDGSVQMEVVPYIDIPPGEIAILARGEMRGIIEGLSRPMVKGGLHHAVLVFERRGRFEMFFMVDPPDDEDEQMAFASPVGDDDNNRIADLLAINTVLRAELGNAPEIIIAPVVLKDDLAVAGWTRGDLGARTFLRQDEAGSWYVEMWSGKSLLLTATLSSLGVRKTAADDLRSELTASEALLGRQFIQRFDGFPGTVVIGRDRSSTAMR